MAGIIKIGTVATNMIEMPDPAEMTVSLQDIDAPSTGRSANGTMIRDRVVGGAAAKRKIELRWPPMYSPGISTILAAISNTFFLVEYPDPYTAARRIGTFYAGDRTLPVSSVLEPGQENPLWKSMSVDLIEQ